MIVPFLAGFSLSASLIIAIGAQNAFVLRQGLRREHVLPIIMVCGLSDTALIAAGVLGFSAMTSAAPWIEPTLTLGGAAFLFWYGARSFWSAWHGGESLIPSSEGASSLKTVTLTCLALTWLNPHVYLDTVVLLGSVSAQYDSKAAFGVGAALASFLFFFALGYGARLLVGLFANPRSWQILDCVIGLVMWTIAVKLIVG
ncbi:MAG: LysE/ArgO family amino acid transporter [Hyphomicrobiales bacterium]|jgi:L-lysine exporter family protein LysE/ArgO